MNNTEAAKSEPASYSQFACIGAGFSGICFGATLKRWYGISDVRIFEKETEVGGTWVINQYPDTCHLAHGNTNNIGKLTKSHRRIYVRDHAAGRSYVHEAQFLFSGASFIHEPRNLDVPGVETFRGPIVHSARWKKDLDLQDKRVAVIGNGCSASRVVPAILDKAQSINQVFRSKHWIEPPIEVQYPLSPFVFLAKHAPWTQTAYHMTKYGSWLRGLFTKSTDKYMRATAPEKYHDILIPDFDLGCRRRIYDPGYLQPLHSDKITLTNEPALEITPEGVRTKSEVIGADVIILANGFKTGQFSVGIDVVGRNGEALHEHWEKFGGPTGYNCTAVSSYPNFFFSAVSPNSGTGHTSLISAIENQVNFALRVIRPVLEGRASSAELKREAEETYTQQLQQDLKKRVWETGGCPTWYVETSEMTSDS
ncbi:hypothetical protein OQA88_2878 [Cercophora sp. LCS_1]